MTLSVPQPCHFPSSTFNVEHRPAAPTVITQHVLLDMRANPVNALTSEVRHVHSLIQDYGYSYVDPSSKRVLLHISLVNGRAVNVHTDHKYHKPDDSYLPET